MGNRHRIEVAFSRASLDSAGETTKNDITDDLGIPGIESVRTSEIYYIGTTPAISESELKKVAESVFIDPLTQNYSLSEKLFKEFDFFIEVRLHEDVTDNVGIVALEGIEDFLGKKLGGRVRTAKRFYIEGKISRQECERIARELLANDVIEEFSVGVKE